MEFVWVVTPRPQESKCMPFPISQIFLTKPSPNPHPKKHIFFLIVIRITMTTQKKDQHHKTKNLVRILKT
jgi:hypothetical protein